MENKYIRANDLPFMTKPLRKAIMNILNKRRSDENWEASRKQRNRALNYFDKVKNHTTTNLIQK